MDANYIIGFPDETREEVMNTIRFAKQNAGVGGDTSGFLFVCLYQVLPCLTIVWNMIIR